MQIRPSLIVCSLLFFLSLSILRGRADATDNLGVLGSKPQWHVLEKYQRTITRDEFAHLVNDVYCTHGFAPDLIKIDNESAEILTNRESHKTFILHFALDEISTAGTRGSGVRRNRCRFLNRTSH